MLLLVDWTHEAVYSMAAKPLSSKAGSVTCTYVDHQVQSVLKRSRALRLLRDKGAGRSSKQQLRKEEESFNVA